MQVDCISFEIGGGAGAAAEDAKEMGAARGFSAASFTNESKPETRSSQSELPTLRF